MTVQARPKTAKYDSGRYQGLSRGDLLRVYRTMYLSRRIDDREVQLKRQNKIFSRSAVGDMKAFWPPQGWCCGPDMTGCIPTIAIARFALRWASRRSRCSCRRWEPRTIRIPVGGKCLPTGEFRG